MTDERLRQRRWFALGAALLTLVLVSPVAVVAYRRSAEAARQDTVDWANSRLDQAQVFFRTGQEPPQNTWQVNVDEGFSSPLGETWTDPPLTSLAEPAAIAGGTAEREFDFDGEWTAVARWISGPDVLVTVVERGDQEAAIAAAQRRWVLIVGTLLALAAAVAYWATGRMADPVDRAHTVNREFIADAAHELRTPLSIIQASAGHALARERSPGEYRESLEEILDATERAGSSVGELLEFARLEAGQAAPRLAPLRLDLLVEEVAASIRVDQTTIEALPCEAVVVEADYNLVRQVIDNITRNAAARADKVTLSTGLETTEARIEIADDGPGFDEGIIDHVFERFRRGDRSGGVGLGMAIARTIVELHGGRCEASNRDEGGALVTVRLPYKPVLDVPEA